MSLCTDTQWRHLWISPGHTGIGYEFPVWLSECYPGHFTGFLPGCCFILLDSHCQYLRRHVPQNVSGRACLPQSSGSACVIPASGKKMAPCVQDDAYRFYFSVSVVFYGHRGHHKKVFLLPRALHHGRNSVNQIPGCNPTVQRDDERT